jgi:hypothetical protein
VVEEDHVPRLLAAEGVAMRAHRLEDVAVADHRRDDRDLLALHGLEQAEVAHHGRHEGVVGESPALLEGEREDRHDLVAVDVVARGVDGQAPVGVAVVGDPEVGSGLDDGAAQRAEVGRPEAVVDVQPVR